MRVLLDECLPRRLKNFLTSHNVKTVQECNWSSKTDTELLALAERDFDVFITIDQNISYQQNTRKYDLLILTIRSKTNSFESIKVLVPKIKACLKSKRNRVRLSV